MVSDFPVKSLSSDVESEESNMILNWNINSLFKFSY